MSRRTISCGSGNQKMTFVRLRKPIKTTVNGEVSRVCPELQGTVYITGVRATKTLGLLVRITNQEGRHTCRVHVSKLGQCDPEFLQRLENVAEKLPVLQV